MVWHHRFQKDCYPIETPEPIHDHGIAGNITIMFYGRLLALADCFDALHRVNSRGKLTGAEVRTAIEKSAPDLRWLVARLYEKKIFNSHDNT